MNNNSLIVAFLFFNCIPIYSSEIEMENISEVQSDIKIKNDFEKNRIDDQKNSSKNVQTIKALDEDIVCLIS